LRLPYAPLQLLALDLRTGSVADYNWITPNHVINATDLSDLFKPGTIR